MLLIHFTLQKHTHVYLSHQSQVSIYLFVYFNSKKQKREIWSMRSNWKEGQRNTETPPSSSAVLMWG